MIMSSKNKVDKNRQFYEAMYNLHNNFARNIDTEIFMLTQERDRNERLAAEWKQQLDQHQRLTEQA